MQKKFNFSINSNSAYNREPFIMANITNSNSKPLDCAICLEEIEKDSPQSILNCYHLFHTACINRWLEGHTTCPLDRGRITSINGKAYAQATSPAVPNRNSLQVTRNLFRRWIFTVKASFDAVLQPVITPEGMIFPYPTYRYF